jgi:hypothetical protein
MQIDVVQVGLGTQVGVGTQVGGNQRPGVAASGAGNR